MENRWYCRFKHCGSFAFSQSRVKVFASLTDVGSMAVGAFDLGHCSLYGTLPCLLLDSSLSLTLVSKFYCGKLVYGD